MAKRNQYNRPTLRGLGGPLSFRRNQRVTFHDVILNGWDVDDDQDTVATAIVNGTLITLSQTANFQAMMLTNVTVGAGEHFRARVTNGHILANSFIFTTTTSGGNNGLRTMLESQGSGQMTIKIFSTTTGIAAGTIFLFYAIFGAA